MVIIPGAALLIGIAVAVLSWRAWTGRWHTWARWPLWSTMPIHLYPSLALFCFGYAANVWLSDENAEIVSVLVFLVIMPLTGLYLLAALFNIEPRWATPRWFHDTDRSPDVRDASTAILAAAAELGQPRRTIEEVRGAFAGQPARQRWGANLVVDPAASRRTHALGTAGTVHGRLRTFDTGLGFHAAASEERLRMSDDDLSAVIIRPEELRAVRTVPRAADADGRRIPYPNLLSRIQRSPYRRLVLDTSHGTYLFELWAAVRRADELAARFEVERGPDA